MSRFVISTTKSKQVVDMTERLEKWLGEKKAKDGVLTVFVAHTTCAVTTADLDPGTDNDLLDALEKIFSKGNYRHPHDPGHVGDHIMSSLIGPSVSIPVEKGKLVLGTWQRLVLVELSGPRERNVVVRFVAV
jgi:secondary thiamine-phosphate synthase enzyme